MPRFRFWKRDPDVKETEAAPTPVSRFNVMPRQDVGTQGLPDDPALAVRVLNLRKRRELLVQEVATAESATIENNRWRAEIALIDQAIEELDGDIELLPVRSGPAGIALDPVPITVTSFTTEPAVALVLTIGGHEFRFEEDLDWAERGFQLARSDLSLVSGDVVTLLPAGLPVEAQTALSDHLGASMLVYASAVRDALLNDEPAPAATLADLAVPSEEHGDWLDWAGHSSFAQRMHLKRQELVQERDRLASERANLIEEEARVGESLPFARRRLAEVDRELSGLLKPT